MSKVEIPESLQKTIQRQQEIVKLNKLIPEDVRNKLCADISRDNKLAYQMANRGADDMQAKEMSKEKQYAMRSYVLLSNDLRSKESEKDFELRCEELGKELTLRSETLSKALKLDREALQKAHIDSIDQRYLDLLDTFKSHPVSIELYREDLLKSHNFQKDFYGVFQS